METTRGTILIKGFFVGSKSDGYKPFLITDHLEVFHLYRAGTYEINDSYFYPFHKKNVEVTGVIQREKFINVHDIREIPDTFNEQPHEPENMPEE